MALSGSILAKKLVPWCYQFHTTLENIGKEGLAKISWQNMGFIVGEPYETSGLELDEINNVAKKWIDLNVRY